MTKPACLVSLWSERVEFAASDLIERSHVTLLAKTSNHMKIIFSLGCGCMCARFCKCVTECVCCHVSSTTFFLRWFVISSIYLFSVNLASFLLIVALDSHLQSPVKPVGLWEESHAGKNTHTHTDTKHATSAQKYLESNPEPFQNKAPFLIPVEAVVRSALSDILDVVPHSLTAALVSKKSAAAGLRHDTLGAKWASDTESRGDLLFLAVKHREMKRRRGAKKRTESGGTGESSQGWARGQSGASHKTKHLKAFAGKHKPY